MVLQHVLEISQDLTFKDVTEANLVFVHISIPESDV